MLANRVIARSAGTAVHTIRSLRCRCRFLSLSLWCYHSRHRSRQPRSFLPLLHSEAIPRLLVLVLVQGRIKGLAQSSWWSLPPQSATPPPPPLCLCSRLCVQCLHPPLNLHLHQLRNRCYCAPVPPPAQATESAHAHKTHTAAADSESNRLTSHGMLILVLVLAAK